MSETDFAASDSSSSWGFDEVKKPPRWILPVGIVSVLLGGAWSIACLLVIVGKIRIGGFEPEFKEGFAGYAVTLWVPLALIVKLRSVQVKHTKKNPGGYDSYAGLVMAYRLKYIALTGLLFALIAMYVAVLPVAEWWVNL